MRANSRHRDRLGRVAAVVAGVAPGGKSLGREDERLDQTSYEELSLQPGFGSFFVGFLQVSKLQQRLQPLEGQLDLPSSPVELHDVRDTGLHERGQHDDVGRCRQSFGPDIAPLFGGLALNCGVLNSKVTPDRGGRQHAKS